MQRRNTTYLILAVLLLLAGGLVAKTLLSPRMSADVDPGVPIPPQFSYHFNLDSFDVHRDTLQPNQFLGDILAAQGVPYDQIDALAREAEEIFSVRRLRAGKPYALVKRKGTGLLDCFVYEPSATEFVRFHIYEEPCVEVIERDVEYCLTSSGGTITSSLWDAMEEIGHRYALIARMEDALAWTVSFYHVQKGDAFKLVYEQKYVDGVPVGVGDLLGAWFSSGGKEDYSIHFDGRAYSGFFDLEGRPMKRAFLKSPVRYAHISSRYSSRRFHPILKRYKGHYGTDYAAPYGAPIMAVADGTVTKAGYTGGNGNYVKIRHDETYETQYLHMSKFARGITPGRRVSQGEVIGYVGATGLATGPHVCFRFWKNGRQVDHLRENLPPPEPMPEADLPEFYQVRDAILPQIDDVAVPAYTDEPA